MTLSIRSSLINNGLLALVSGSNGGAISIYSGSRPSGTGLRFRQDLINVGLLALLAAADGGTIAMYHGTRPANTQASAAGSTLVAELPLLAPAFSAGLTDQVIANFGSPATASSSLSVSWFRIFGAGGHSSGTSVCDGTLGIDATFSGTMAAGKIVECTDFEITTPDWGDDGVATPPDPSDAIADLPLSDPGFAAGVFAGNIVAQFAASAVFDSLGPVTPTWFRVWTPGGVISGQAICDGSISGQGNVDGGAIETGDTIQGGDFEIGANWL